MKKLSCIFFVLCLTTTVFAKAVIDADVITDFNKVRTLRNSTAPAALSILIFLHSPAEKKIFLAYIKKFSHITVQNLSFMPAVAVTLPVKIDILNQLANHSAAAHIASYHPSLEELDVNVQVSKLFSSIFYPDLVKWWAHGYTGKKGVLGLIDEGVDPTHPALVKKQLVVRTEGGSHYEDFLNGVKTPHGTGVACIYASQDEKYKGVAYDVPTIVSGPSGAENPEMESILMTMSTVDWMLTRSAIKPTLINYSMGNGQIACPGCPEWSGLAKVIDYVVNRKKILWVKSAGNAGYIEPTKQIPFASTLTVPGDNYNGLTVANMDINLTKNDVVNKLSDLDKHIRSTSSRGPTPYGRKKPDLTAPGHNTRTCAPDPEKYHFNYTTPMDYHDGYRLMGGTSSAAPHVGGSAILLQDAGIQNPMAIKALLINSADSWTDSGKPDGEGNAHFSVMGSEWNRTYGWGYINMAKAFEQRKNIIEDQLSLKNPVMEYLIDVDVGGKITLVHERRVGYFVDSSEWQLSHLSLEIIDRDTEKVIAQDDSPIDTVHQVANCERDVGERNCSTKTMPIHALVRVKLLSNKIDGNITEPFALVFSNK